MINCQIFAKDGETAARIQKTGSRLPTSYSGVTGMKAVDLSFRTRTATGRGAAEYLVSLYGRDLYMAAVDV